MKNKFKIKGFYKILLIFIIIFSFSVSALAAEEESKSKVIEECFTQKTSLLEYIDINNKNYNKKSLSFEKPYTIDFRLKMESAKELYHNYISCLFDMSVSELLASPAGNTDGILSANSPSTPEFVKDLLDPKKACISTEKKKELLDASSPNVLIPDIMEVNYKYREYLNALYIKFTSLDLDSSIFTSNVGSKMANVSIIFKRFINNEISNSNIALNTAFQSLKDFRKYYSMHIQYQCMLKNLEEYRKSLENLRSVIYLIPDLFRNASKH